MKSKVNQPMDEHRRYAYRFLIYWAMLEIRTMEGQPFWRILNPFGCWRHFRKVNAMGALANWLHSLADFSTREFTGLDEKRFLSEYDVLQRKHPELKHYQDVFHKSLAESQTGQWPR